MQGTTTHLEQGSLVTLTIGDQSYSASVKADGSWALTILAGQLAPLDDGSYQMKVSSQDKAGNVASATQPVTIDSHETSATASSEPLNISLVALSSDASPIDQSSDHRVMDSQYSASDNSFTLGDHVQQQHAVHPLV
jgi:hypothetical protein